MGFSKSVADTNRERAISALEEFLRPEFLARIDEIVTFSALNEDSLCKIAVLMLNDLSKTLKEKGIELCVEKDVYSYLAKHNVGAKSGARELRNSIRRHIEDPVVDILIENSSNDLSKIFVNLINDKIFIKKS